MYYFPGLFFESPGLNIIIITIIVTKNEFRYKFTSTPCWSCRQYVVYDDFSAAYPQIPFYDETLQSSAYVFMLDKVTCFYNRHPDQITH